jgi:hypothetical protein
MDRNGQIRPARVALRWNILEVLVNTWRKSSTLAGVLGVLLLGYVAVTLLDDALQTALIVLALLIGGYSVPWLFRVGMVWYFGEEAD